MRNVPTRTWLPALLLAVSLIVLAVLQFRWIGEVSRAESLRLRTGMERDVELAVRNLDEELNNLLLAFSPLRSSDVNEAVRKWRSNNVNSDLLRGILRVDFGPPQRRARQRERPALEQFNEELGEFQPAVWAVELRPVLRFLLRDRRLSEGLRDGFGEIEPTQPALVLRLLPERREPPGQQRRSTLVLLLERTALDRAAAETLFPELEQSLGNDFAFRILDDQNLVTQTSVEVWPASANAYRSDLLRLPGAADLRKEVADRVRQRYRELSIPVPPWLSERRLATNEENSQDGKKLPIRTGVWTLEVAHKSGDLESVITRARWRNLAISTAILGLLGCVILYLLRAASRDRLLAERQLDFVAGLTHELHTPLAAIKSAGANLADGVVADPGRVREYGTMLQKEGGRLSDLVSQALALAGMESSGEPAHRDFIEVSDLLKEAVDRTRLVATENTRQGEFDSQQPVQIDLVQDDETLGVRGDREALLRALTNLLNNAVKFGATAISLSAKSSQSELEISVSDNGPGVAPADRQSIFEPYVRGANVAAPGSGLGLHLARRIAEQHGGTLQLLTPSPSGTGACFVLHLPLANDPPSR